jgi:hypothetical protein
MATLNKLCIHHTAGTSKPCATDIEAYHYLIDDLGRIYEGKYKPEDNLNCNDGIYTKHCGGGNTGCIGISACGNYGYDLKNKKTKYPLTKKQIETLCCLAAYLSLKYKFPVNENSVFTHYEFDRKKPKPEGKVDITFIPYLPNLAVEKVGNYLRNKIVWYIIQLKNNKYTLTKKGNHYEFI